MSKYLLLDSYHKINGTSTNFTIQLAQPIKITNYIKLISANIPNTAYVINEFNNTMTVTFADTTIKNIVLPFTNYTPSSLASAINIAVNYATFNMIYNTNTFKFDITATQNFTLSWQNNSQIFILFGYQNNTSKFSTVNALTTNVIDMSGTNYLLIDIQGIESNLYSHTNYPFNFYIANSSSVSDYITYQSIRDNENKNIVHYDHMINQISVRIFDQYGRIWNNNNVNLSLIFEFE